MSTGSFSIVAILLFVFVPGAMMCAACADEVDPIPATWPTLGGDFRRAGLSGDEGPIPGRVKWKFETDGAVIGSVTVGSDGRIHVACEDGKLYALDSGGASLWTFDVNTPLLSAATIDLDGQLYVGDGDGGLHAFDAGGHCRWTYSRRGAVYSSPAVGADGSVYLGCTDGTLYALGQDGEELWEFKTKGPGSLPDGAVFASPSLGADGTVYVAGLYDSNLYALDPSDGAVRWTCRFPVEDPNKAAGWPWASPVVADDGVIYQTLLHDTHLYAVEPNAGTIVWSADLCDPSLFGGDPNAPADSDGWSEPVLGPDGTIYVSLDDPYLRAVDPNGAVRWVTKLGEVGGFTLTVDSRHVIYAASDDGFLYAVAADGEELVRFETGGWPVFPVVAGPDVLILADSRDYSSLEEDARNAVWAIESAALVEAASRGR